VTTTLTALCTNEVDTDCKCLCDVLRVADHVHNDNTSVVQLLNNLLRWDTDGTYEECCLLFDDDINEVIQLACEDTGSSLSIYSSMNV
jgi:hypothetical protein